MTTQTLTCSLSSKDADINRFSYTVSDYRGLDEASLPLRKDRSQQITIPLREDTRLDGSSRLQEDMAVMGLLTPSET